MKLAGFSFQRYWRSLRLGQKLDLSYLFGLSAAATTPSQQAQWLRSLMDWLHSSGDEPQDVLPRIKFLLQLLERNPEWRLKSANLIRSLLHHADGTRLYSETGLPNHTTWSSEFLARLARVLIPHFDDPRKLSALCTTLFDGPYDAEIFRALPEETLQEILRWLATGLESGDEIWPEFDNDMAKGALILVNRCLTISLREDVADRSPEFKLPDHPLLQAQGLLVEMERREAWSPEDCDRLLAHLHRGQEVIRAVRSHMEEQGVTVDLVYQMDRIKSDLHRVIRIVNFLKVIGGDQAAGLRAFRMLWFELLRGVDLDRNLGYLTSHHFGLLARKVVERAGSEGEHYAIQNWAEYRHFLFAGAGAGILTVGTIFVKYAVDTKGWPLFLDFCYVSLNYSLSFLIMHVVGFKLATKQPSVQANHLALRLKVENAEGDEEFIQEVARITRSQFVTLIGNVGAVVPGSLLAGWIIVKMTGHPFFSDEKAVHVAHSLNPILSGTLFYATITGFLLWSSAVIAGWAENFSAFHQIPRLIATHPFIRNLIGAEGAQRFADRYARNVTGVVASVVFGVLLGFVPLLGKFFGLPLDIRHVTLSSGAAATAFLTLPWDGLLFAGTAIGIACIAALNFGVSFAFSLFIAMKAREIPMDRGGELFLEVGKRFLRNPRLFLFPPRSPTV